MFSVPIKGKQKLLHSSGFQVSLFQIWEAWKLNTLFGSGSGNAAAPPEALKSLHGSYPMLQIINSISAQNVNKFKQSVIQLSVHALK